MKIASSKKKQKKAIFKQNVRNRSKINTSFIVDIGNKG